MPLIRTNRRPGRAGAMTFPGFGSMPSFEDIENRMRKAFEGNLIAPFTDLMAQPIGWLPATDIVEVDSEITLTLELPGLERKDVEILIEDDVLTIRGEKAEEKKDDESAKFHLFERTYGSFQRSFTLPRSIDGAKIVAEFDKGVLKIHMPKTVEAQAKGRKIEIQAK